jgi:hypothetical protein
MRTRVIVVLWLLTCTPSAGFSQQPVRVFVTSSAVKGGAVDKAARERQDAAADLVGILAGQRELVLVTTEPEAQVVVEITKRAMEATGERYKDSTTKAEQVVRSWRVYATLKAGDYMTQMMGESHTVTKKDAAKAVARQVTDWIAKNPARLEKKNGAPPSMTPRSPRTSGA